MDVCSVVITSKRAFAERLEWRRHAEGGGGERGKGEKILVDDDGEVDAGTKKEGIGTVLSSPQREHLWRDWYDGGQGGGGGGEEGKGGEGALWTFLASTIFFFFFLNQKN